MSEDTNLITRVLRRARIEAELSLAEAIRYAEMNGPARDVWEDLAREARVNIALLNAELARRIPQGPVAFSRPDKREGTQYVSLFSLQRQCDDGSWKTVGVFHLGTRARDAMRNEHLLSGRRCRVTKGVGDHMKVHFETER